MAPIKVLDVLIIISVSNLLLIHAQYEEREGMQLECIKILHRHGQRYPVQEYQNDPYKNETTKAQMGTLKPTGIAAMYESGKRLYERYANTTILPPCNIYTNQYIQVESSNPERCIMSTQCLMAGFVRPDPKCNPLEMEWQPIPVHVLPGPTDYKLFQDQYVCPKWIREYQEFLNDPKPRPDSDYCEFNQAHLELYEYMTNHTGKKINNVDDCSELCNILDIEAMENKTLPFWTEKVYPDACRECRSRAFQLICETREMAKLKGGPWITELVETMRGVQNGSVPQTILCSSAHDKTISNVGYALELTDKMGGVPEYGAMFVMELLRNITTRKIILLIQYYAHTSQRVPTQLNLEKCPYPCTVDQFVEAYGDVMITDFDSECAL